MIFFVNAPLSTIIFRTEIPLLASLTAGKYCEENSKSLEAKEANLILTVVRGTANS